jgi:SWI/SNF-related matrix-associated actin-dependent regulator of chromatin subfamily A-like protein 1
MPMLVQAFLLDSNLDKFLVFAHHQNLLDAAEKVANRKGARYIRIDGSVKAERRGELVRTFQEEASVRMAILSIKAAGTGLTLTSASTVVFAEMYWVPGDMQQAEDRVHRVGQACSVDCNYLLLKGSVDDLMWDILQSKTARMAAVLDGAKSHIAVCFSFQWQLCWMAQSEYLRY